MQEQAYMWDCSASPREMMSLTEDADFVIGMRYHALVFAVATATPFVALSYDPKVDGLLSIVGEKPGFSRSQRDEGSFFRHVKDAWNRREEMKANFLSLSPTLGESAKHVAYLAVNTAKKHSRP
jgi:polysaccharide pyruvyl transferase WcaK-like protein